MDRSLTGVFARRFAPIVGLAVMAIAASIPATYYLLTKRSLEAHAQLYSQQIAMRVATIVQANPRYWQYDLHPFLALDQSFGSLPDDIRFWVENQDGRIVHTPDAGRTHLFLVAESAFHYNDRVVGTVRVGVSSRELFQTTRTLALGSAAGAGLIGLFLFGWPIRILQRLEGALTEQIRHRAHETLESAALARSHRELRDSHERSVALVAELKHSHAEIERKHQELETVIAMVSHDLKNPVLAMQHMGDDLRRDCRDRLDAPELTRLDHLLNTVDHLEDLIADFLEYSRAGRADAYPQPVDARAEVEALVAQCRALFPDARARVSVDPLPVIQADPVQFRQVFMNLLTNGFKFAPAGTDPHIEIGAADHPEGVLFWVKDHGVGIDPSDHHWIFGLFNRGEQTEETDGTGVGLAIVRRIVDRIGGRIWVESVKGSGATFFVSWPQPRPRIDKPAAPSA